MRTDETIDAIVLYYAQGWTDGLPVVPPTRAKVQTMVERSGRVVCEVLAGLPLARWLGERGTHGHERRDGRMSPGVYASDPDSALRREEKHTCDSGV